MSDFFEVYQKRMNLKGRNKEEAKINSGKHILEKTFDSSLSSYTLLVDNVMTDVIAVSGKTSKEKTFLFKPNYVGRTGMIIVFESSSFLVTDYKTNLINSSAKARQCNNSITLTSELSESVVIGYDDLGRPVYDDVESEEVVIPCICDTVIKNDDTERAINLPQEQMLVTIPYTEHEDLNYDKELILYGSHFKIIGIDDTESIDKVGLRRLTLERVAD
ncbi:hypothetical protein [Priestia megaterium]|uniref:hypothetical protein n=1 Tax=Priestia megaterium TaxID=1404 RepID=UPI003CC62195